MKKIVCVVAAVLTLLLGAACAAPRDAAGEPVPPVSFSYSFGSFNGGQWDYDIKELDGRYYLTAVGSNGVSMDVMRALSGEEMAGLARVIADNGVTRWNGFRVRDPFVLDGYSFSLAVDYGKAGPKISASGYMKYPKNYDAGHEALAAYLEKLAAEAPAEQVEEGAEVWSVNLVLAPEGTGFALSRTADGGWQMAGAWGSAAVDAQAAEAFCAQALELYNAYPGVPMPEDAVGGGWLTITAAEGELTRQYALRGNAAEYGGAYEELREDALALAGAPADFQDSDEFWAKQKFGYKYVAVYDSELGEAVVDFPAKTVTVDGKVMEGDATALLEFYAVVDEVMSGHDVTSRYAFRDNHCEISDALSGEGSGVEQYMALDKTPYRWLFFTYYEGYGFPNLYGGESDPNPTFDLAPRGWETMTGWIGRLAESAA